MLPSLTQNTDILSLLKSVGLASFILLLVPPLMSTKADVHQPPWTLSEGPLTIKETAEGLLVQGKGSSEVMAFEADDKKNTLFVDLYDLRVLRRTRSLTLPVPDENSTTLRALRLRQIGTKLRVELSIDPKVFGDIHWSTEASVARIAVSGAGASGKTPKVTGEKLSTAIPKLTNQKNAPSLTPPTPEAIAAISPRDKQKSVPLPEPENTLLALAFVPAHGKRAGELQVTLSNQMSFELRKEGDAFYQLTLEGAKPAGAHLLLPQFAPRDLDGFQSCVLEQGKDALILTIRTESGFSLLPLVDGETLHITAIKQR